MFCPECGKPLAEQSPVTENAPDSAVEPREMTEAAPVASADTAGDNPAIKTVRSSKTARASEMVRHGGEKTRETLHKASSAARGAIEDNVKRVEKIHHVSTVMLEEAHYDASLRFVLVALGLFVVFVVLLIISKVMG